MREIAKDGYVIKQVRPKKKKYNIGDDPRHEGYNQACDDWEKYWEEEHTLHIESEKELCKLKESLPTVEEIEEIMGDLSLEEGVLGFHNFEWVKIPIRTVAKAIHKRLRGES